MKRSKAQYARLMDLDRVIRAGKHPNCLSFAADWEVSQKTVQRDIDFLRDQCGAPLRYDKLCKGFLYEDPTWMLPSVMLSEGELFALLLASRALETYRGTPMASRLQRVFAKLADLLPERLSIRPELLFDQFTFTAPASRPVSEEVWSTVIRGLLDRRTILLRYRAFHSETTRRDKQSAVNPYHVANLQGEWYVFGVHAGHGDVRQFAMARIEKASLTDKPFEMSADFDPRSLLDATFGRYAGGGTPHAVRLVFDKAVADWIAERQWHPRQAIKQHRNGDIELSFPAKGLYEVQRWVLSWGSSVRVAAPAELKKNIEDEVARMAAAARRA